jgi:hypothetical protein
MPSWQIWQTLLASQRLRQLLSIWKVTVSGQDEIKLRLYNLLGFSNAGKRKLSSREKDVRHSQYWIEVNEASNSNERKKGERNRGEGKKKKKKPETQSSKGKKTRPKRH